MIRFDLPDDATDEEIEAYLDSLHESARAEVRRMIASGASPEEIGAYLAEVETQLEAEDEALEEA